MVELLKERRALRPSLGVRVQRRDGRRTPCDPFLLPRLPISRTSREEGGGYRPTKQCRTATKASPHTRTEGLVQAWSAKRSSVVTTLPLVLFSRGTMPRLQDPDWTAVKTEGMVGEGMSVWPRDGGKDWIAALERHMLALGYLRTMDRNLEWFSVRCNKENAIGLGR